MVDTVVNFPAILIVSELLPVVPVAGALPGEAVQLARDLVAGYSGDYLFFQYDEDEYTLILSDAITETAEGYTCDGFQWFDIHVMQNVETSYRNNSGTLSGTIVGVEGGVAAESFSGQINGSYEVQTVKPASIELHHDSFEDSLTVTNTNHAVIYSGFAGTPSLVDGAQKYGFMVSALISASIAFFFVHSLFKRVR